MGLTRAQEDRPTPPEVYNIRIYSLAFLACFGSWMFGYNNGVISGVIVLPSFFHDFDLPPVNSTEYNNITSNIVSFLQIGGLIGSMATFPGMKYGGRRVALIVAAGVYLVGAVLQAFSYGRLGMVYAGRFITGIGLGGVTVVVPLYLAELSPPAIRGTIVGIYEINNQLSSLVGYWCNYLVKLYISDTSTRQWQIPLAMQIIPSALLLMMSIGVLPESPRFLVAKGKTVQARKILAFIRHLPQEHEYINGEIAEFEAAHEAHERVKKSSKGRFGLVRELGWKGNRNRVAIGLFLMFAQNLTAINAVNFYTPSIFRSVGIADTNAILLASGMFAVVKTVTTIFSLVFLIDRAGRRNLLIISAIGMSASLWYIGGYITGAHVDLSVTQSKTPAGWVAIVAIYIYAAFFSIAWNGVVWVYCSEIFPARIKELAVCITTGTQWVSQFAVSRASPYMLSSMHGGFFMFFASCVIGMVIVVYFFVPETKGRGLEKMDEIFGTPYSNTLDERFTELEQVAEQEKGGKDLEQGKSKGGEELSRARDVQTEQAQVLGMLQTV